ncbi:sporulation integral membrane protein YtvI [Sporofaciens sp. SGI.106]|uniref:sporulation integral membrane protein YtvI n=1 Tax=Sporofaciens sp. SGI.106 TaxID=3420568 RepID=UPI002A9B7FB1|nr:sporulation integral membrane protein YtvI [Lachnoclostridium sp.]
MQMSVRERLNDNRPYWKVLVSLVFSLIGTILFIYLGIRALIYFMPFVIGWFLAFIASPLVTWLEQRLKIVKKLGSAITIILVLCACVGVIYFAVSRVWAEIASLIQNFPEMYEDLEAGFMEIGIKGEQLFARLPQGVQNGWQAMMQNLDQTMGKLIGEMSEPTMEVAGSVAKRIPSIFVATIVTFVSAYFFIAQREEIIIWAKKISPKPIVSRMTMVMDNLKYAVGGYFKAQFKIMAVVFLMLLAGFSLIGVHFSILLALGIAFLDFLPFFGTGTALIPWAVYKFLVGNYRMAIALLILYAVTQVVRQLIQPKLVGDSMGMNPLLTLVLLYIGYKLGSVLGMIFAVPIGMIVVNLYQAGAFDYILDDVRILMEGIMSLRE